MDKGVMYSIQPYHCDNIAGLRKNLELRKRRPVLEPPFVAYIYETKGKQTVVFEGCTVSFNGRGKVIGEFICDRIDEFEAEFCEDGDKPDGCMEQIKKVVYIDEYGEKDYDYITGNEVDNPDDCKLCRDACLSYQKIRKYIGYGINTFYGIHISQLKMYDKPKKLSEFIIEGECDCVGCRYCGWVGYPNNIPTCEIRNGYKPLKRAPQSWCYVEVQRD